jgi:hypothetical protein
VPAERLAIVRLLVGGFAVYYFARRFRTHAAAAGLDAEGFQPVGVVNLLSTPLSHDVSVALLWATLLMGSLFTLGFRFRVIGPCFALLTLWVTTYRSSWGMIFHSENLLFWHVAILAASPATRALSLDTWRERQAAVEVESVSGWSLRLMTFVTAATYFLAGVAKLRGTGWVWATGEALRNHVAFNALRKVELGGGYSEITAWLLTHAWIFQPFAWGTLLLELSGPFVLFNRKLVRAWAVGMFVFHWGIDVVMDISFLYPLSGIAFVACFPVERALLLLRKWRRSGSFRHVTSSTAGSDR